MKNLTRVDVRQGPSDEELIGRIRGEYLEMPGLRLTRPQARRLWGLDEHTSDRLLSMLVERKFLTCAPDGAFVRLTDGTFPARAFRMARAEVETDLAAQKRRELLRRSS
jgi:hypothetical protein